MQRISSPSNSEQKKRTNSECKNARFNYYYFKLKQRLKIPTGKKKDDEGFWICPAHQFPYLMALRKHGHRGVHLQTLISRKFFDRGCFLRSKKDYS